MMTGNVSGSCCRTFVGTNLCPHWEHFLAPDVGEGPLSIVAIS